MNLEQAHTLLEQASQLITYTIGRQAQNQLVLADGRVSGQHARLIQCSPESYILEDLNSKNGTFVNHLRITRKLIDHNDVLRFGDTTTTARELIARYLPLPPPAETAAKNNPLDFTADFAALKQVYEQYPQLKRDCRNRERMIRTGSVILSSVVSVGAVLGTGGSALAFLPVLSSAGLSILVPTLCSTLLSTDEKLEVIDKEYRERYRCPNPECRLPFYNQEWEQLARQKTCRHCKAIWVS
nr:FHA domain-containing protein [uncultured Arsenicibacter sp.]